jgi:BirA family biotin operon repressor/biotin-[acetyl-CoA-carboxylase] ligase
MGRELSELRPATRWVACRWDVHAELDSTNLWCEALAARGAPDGTVVIADRQTAGRGRLGRSFFSPAGRGLYLSLLLRPRTGPEQVHRHIFAAAAAVAECARAELPASARVEIKWPNDVLVERRKLSGINLPVQLEGMRVASAVLGVGINLNTRRDEFPPELRDTATSLYEASGREVDRVAFAEGLLLQLERQIDRIRAGEFEAVLNAWRKWFRMSGAAVAVGGPGVRQPIRGTVRGVDSEGALLLDTGRAIERVLAGDVTLLGEERR